MRYSLSPIVFLRQNERGVAIYANGYGTGYDAVVYGKEGDVTNQKVMKLNSPYAFISELDKGRHSFYLANQSANTAPDVIYYTGETRQDIFTKILSYIANPEDAAYMQGVLEGLTDIPRTYTEALAERYKHVNDRQPYETRSFYQLISVMERYENTQAIAMNRNILGDTSLAVGSLFSLNLSPLITAVDIFRMNDGSKIFERRLDATQGSPDFSFGPNNFYVINLYSDAELVAELVHYEFDEEGASYLWSQTYDELEKMQNSILNDADLISHGIYIDPEDKQRIIVERSRENRDAFMPRLIVKQSVFHDTVLTITIPKYELLHAMGKQFYVSVREPDQFYMAGFDKRYPIYSDTLEISCQKELLAGEIILFIEDENQVIVSPFTRFDLDAEDDGSMEEYSIKQCQLEMLDYADRYLKNFAKVYGEGELYSIVSEMVSEQTGVSEDIVPEEAFFNILVQQARDARLHENLDSIICFTATEWMNQFNYSTNFFGRAVPQFVNNLDTFHFPVAMRPYVLIVECLNGVTPSTCAVKHIAESSSFARTTDVDITNGDMYLIYAIDCDTYKRSGYILVNNITTRAYYTNNIEVEAHANGN